MISRGVLILLLASTISAQYSNYGGGGSASANVESSSESKAPVAPMAPPRIPMPADIVGASLGYRPPPPPVRREEESIGQCAFGKL